MGRAKNFRVTIQHPGQTNLKQAFSSADVAISWAREAHNAGATTAMVHRASDGVVIFNAVTGFEMDIFRWND